MTKWATSLAVAFPRRYRRRSQHIGVMALVAALDARDHYTTEHSRAVVELSTAVARRLGVPRVVIEEVKQVALLHDVGKIGVPDSILNKPGPLTITEWAVMRRHPVIGERIASSVRQLAHLARSIRSEHERWDGNGYPDGLAGRAIPLASRIVLACDAYHAMISDRPYRTSIGRRRAMEELRRCAGRQFCPETATALLSILRQPQRAPAPALAATFLHS